ncbi:TAXI family TRAP transporter solute-binding subunit [Natribaculum luteum]|uniref:TAXI family TRAP transporter solute-binding subunit n=1 Tax=Natribaculum luteum TaxID=1586232 RepID=A0ABD5P206_9EURY|nr:TAXI family TRAP transporter solute-binding subunit [Natribaculum luteum]
MGGDGGNGNSSDGGGGGGTQGQLTTAGGTPGGTGYAIMNAALSTASAEFPELGYNILPGGWVGNNTRLQNKELDIAHTTIVAATLAANGQDPYNDKDWEQPPANLRAVMADQTELFYYVVAQPDFQYDTLAGAAEDEAALTVMNQPEGTFGGFVWDTALEELGYGQDQIEEYGGEYRRTTWDDAAQMFVDEDLDLILAVSGRSVGWLSTITATRDVNYLDWTEENRDYFSEEYGLQKADLEAETLPQQSDTLNTMQDSGLIAGQVDAPDEAVRKVVQGVITNADQFRQSTDILAPFEASEAMFDSLPYELHQGAQQAYEEEGMM